LPELAPIHELERVGGRLCLDFVNTANWLEGQAVDERLVDPTALRTWCERVGVPLSDGFESEGELEAVHALRAAIRRIARSGLPEAPAPREADWCRIAEARREEPPALGLREGQSGLEPLNHWGQLERVLADSLVELLVDLDPRRLKECDGERCGWLFYDASPTLRRRWCSMRTCGNRAKVNRYYDRQKESE